MGERLLCKQEVIGSIPFASTILWWTSTAQIGILEDSAAFFLDERELGLESAATLAVLCHCE